MATLGIEMCDSAFHAATCQDNDTQPLAIADANGVTDWPGFAYFDGQKFEFGRSAENQWFVHPRRVSHSFWARLAHEPSTVGPPGRLAPFSELSFHFFREFMQRLASGPKTEKVVLAVPGAYLRDPATEEEKIGLLLGMAGELKLPLAGIVDMACAALCDPRAHGFNPALPVVVIDLHLEGADVTLLATDGRLERLDFIHLPQSGYAQLLKHLTGTMGNRFLRHTAFDILEDGRIEQMFFRQTKDFLRAGTPEHRFQINTSSRAYEMLAKREQLVSDAQPFVQTLAQAVQGFLRDSPHATEPCTLALTFRAASLPGFGTKLRSMGYHRILRLDPGAAACGAARIGESRLHAAADMADVPVESAVPVSLARQAASAAWEAHLHKMKSNGGSRPPPTHVILDGIGHFIGKRNRFTIGVAGRNADVALPDAFSAADECTIQLVRESGRLCFLDSGAAPSGSSPSIATAPRTAIESGDRLAVRCGDASVDLLFASCPEVNGLNNQD